VKIFHNSIAKFPFYTGIENGNFSKWRNSRFTGIGNGNFSKWRNSRFTGIEKGNFSKWRNSRFIPALKRGIFQNGGIPVLYRH
jgi:hypothetical protein